MAKRKNYGKRSAAATVAKSKTTGATAIKVLAVVLMILLAAYVTISLVFGAWSPVGWTAARQEQINGGGKNPGADNGGNNGGTSNENGSYSHALVNVAEECGINVMAEAIAIEDYADYGISTQAETAYTVTATVNSDAVYKQLIWGFSFKNPSSEWANGKKVSDYATITVSEDTLSAVLAFPQAFGEQLVLKASSAMDGNVFAVCYVDYLKSVTGFSVQYNDILPSASTSLGSLLVGAQNTNRVTITPTYGVGTVTGTVSNVKHTFTFHNTLLSNLNSNLKAGTNTSGFTMKGSIERSGTNFNIPFSIMFEGTGTTTNGEIILNNYFFANGYTDAGGSPIACTIKTSVSFDYMYGTQKVQTLNQDFTQMPICSKGLTKKAVISSVDLDKDGIVVIPN